MWLHAHGYVTVNSSRRTFRGRVHYPLHDAVLRRDAHIVRLLLDCGAERWKPTSTGRTALDLAERRNWFGLYNEIIAILEGRCE